MYESTSDGISVRSIDLAEEAGFHLGKLHVQPATCDVEFAGNSQILQRRVMQVLVALANARGAVVSQRDLIARCWGGLTVSDDAIYRCISKLRRLAAGFGDVPFTIDVIPGVGYRLVAADVPAVPSVSKKPATPPGRSHLRPLIAIAAILVLVVGGAAFWMLQERASAPETLRVSVQPFEVMSNSATASSLARRISNEVVDVLGDNQIETVLVEEQPKATANFMSPRPSLTVTGILRDDGRNAVVDLRLEDGATRAALWSVEFKRDSLEASDLPLEVAARVADAVNMVDFARHANPPLTDDSALTALIQAGDMIRGANDEAWAPMLQKTQHITARHPDFAFGHSILAAALAWASENINNPVRARAMRDAARREAELTLKLDPHDAGAYTVLSGLLPPYDYRRREAIFQRGMKLAKHPKQALAGLNSYYGMMLADVGRLHEALSLQLVAHATDEWGPARSTKLADIYANMGNAAAARNALQRAVQYWPNHPGVWKRQQYIAGFYEAPSEALKAFKLLDSQSSLRESNAIWRIFVGAKTAQAEQVTQAAVLKIRVAGDQGTISREHEIMMLAGLGKTKQAIEVANSALDHGVLEPWFLFTPVTRELRRDSAFIPLASRMGLIQYWRETGERPDICTNSPAGSECTPQLLGAIRSS